MDWNNFLSFISGQNNVTWRNFNVVNNVPPAGAQPPGFVALPFLVTGAPDRARRMAIEVAGRLPEGARLLLEIPRAFLERTGRQPHTKSIAKGDMAVLPVNPHGKLRLGDAPIPAKARMHARLLAQIPKAAQAHEFEVYVRQMFGEQEVGRVTWRLTPERKGKERRTSKGD
jgi:hypothetical protein